MLSRGHLKKLGQEFLKDEISLRSAGVSYYLFFSLIPIVTTLVSLVLMLPLLELNAEQILIHLTRKLLPEAIYDVKGYFISFSENAGYVSLVSLVISTYVLSKIIHFFEESLNRFWRLEVKRSVSRVIKKALILYFLATLGVVISITLRNQDIMNFLVELLVSIIMFLGFNRIVPAWKKFPHNGVNWKTLLPGSILCGSIWYITKWGFTVYIDRFAKTEVAAVLGIIPLFLVWLKFSSYLLLLSAILNREIYHFFGSNEI
jgi:YihY family inner membrane protein